MRSEDILKTLVEKMVDGLRLHLEEEAIKKALAEAEIECDLTITLEGGSIQLSGSGAKELALYMAMIHLYLSLKENLGEDRAKEAITEILSPTVREYAIPLVETGAVKMLPDAIKEIANNMYMAEMELRAKSAISTVEEAITPAKEASGPEEKASVPSGETPHGPPLQQESLPEPPPPPDEPLPESPPPVQTGTIEVESLPVEDSMSEPQTPEEMIKEFMRYPRITERRARKLYGAGITSIKGLRLLTVNEISIRLNLPMSISERIYNGIQHIKQPVEVAETPVGPSLPPSVTGEETQSGTTEAELPVEEAVQPPLVMRPPEIPPPTIVTPPRMENGFKMPYNGARRRGMINGQREGRVRVRYKQVRRRRALVAVVVLVMLLLGTVFSIFAFGPYNEPITIDGKFDDWTDKRIVQDSRFDATSSDIVNYSVVAGRGYIFVYVHFASRMFLGKGISKNESLSDSLRLFIDIDHSPKTGYYLRDQGMDCMVHLAWVNDTLMLNTLSDYAGAGLDFQWKAFSSVAAKQSNGRVEIGIPRGERLKGIDPWVIISAKGWNGAEDYSDAAIGDGSDGLLVDVDIMLPTIITSKSLSVLDLFFIPVKGSVMIEEIELSILGDPVIVTEVSASMGGKTYPGAITGEAVNIKVDSEVKPSNDMKITAALTQISTGEPFGLKLTRVKANAPATIKVNGDFWASYMGSAPSSIQVDGALGEWGTPTGDAASSVKQNNDIMSHLVLRDGSSTSFLITVRGDMMGGTGVPVGVTVISTSSPSGNQSKPQVPIGEDRWTMYLGSANDTSGDWNPKFNIYAKWKVEATGKNGDVIFTKESKFDSGKWSESGSVQVEPSVHSMELQVKISDAFLIAIESSDWEGKSVDYVTTQSRYDSPQGPSILATTVDLSAAYDVTVTRSAACGGGGATYGRENYSHIDVGTNGTKCGRGILRFDLSSIPKMAIISSASLIVYVLVESTNGNHRTNIRRVVDDPLTASDVTLYNDASSGAQYLRRSKFLSSGSGTGWKSLTLGGTVAADLTASLTAEWFALGMAIPTVANRAYGQIASREYSGGGYTTILRVTYSVPTITLSLASSAPANVYQGDADVVMGSFNISLNAGVKTVTHINITRYTTSIGSDSDVSTVRLYNDTNGDGLLGIGDVLLAPQTTFALSLVQFPLSLVVSSATPIRILVVFNISVTAVPFNKDGAKINSTTDIRATGVLIQGPPVELGASLINAKRVLVSLGSVQAPSVVYRGDNDIVMGQLFFVMNTGTDTITSIAVTRYTASTGSDSDLGLISLFYDSNNDGSLSGETQIGTDQALASGVATFSGISVPVDGVSGIRILVVADISGSATIGNSDGFRLQAGADVVSTYQKSGAFPISLGASVIDRRSVIVSMGGFTAPSLVPLGSTDIVMGQFTLRTNNATDTVISISITRYGLSSDADTASVRLFYDSNDDGSAIGETQIGAQTTFSSGVATFNGLSLPISTTAIRILVVFNVSISAIIDDTIGASIDSSASITASSFPVTGTFPIQLGLAKIISTALMVAKGGFSAPTAVYQGTNDVVMGQFTLRMSSSSDNIMQINITKYGTSSDADIASVRLYYDSNNDGSFSGETQIGTQQTFASGVARFNAILVPVTTTIIRVLVVFNFDPAATVGATVEAAIDASSDVRTSSYPVSGTFPISLGGCVIRGTLLIAAGGYTAPANVYQGALDVVMGQFTLATNQGTTTVTRVNVTRYTAGIGSDADIASVRLYYDSNNDGSISGESQIGTSQTFAGGIASFTGLGVNVDSTTTRILIVFNFTNTAVVNNNDGARIASSADVESNFIRSGVFPISLGTSTILANSLRVSIGAFTAPAQMFQTQSSLVIGQFALNTSAGLDSVTSITVTRYTTGVGADTDIASVRLFYDSNNDGSIIGESQVGVQQTFAAGTATFSGLSISVGSTPKRILVVINVSGTAPIGNNDGCRIAAAGSVTASSFPVTGAFPVNMGTSTVTARALQVSDPDGSNPPPPTYSTAGDAGIVMGRLKLAMNFGTDTVTAMTLTRTGTGADLDMAVVKLVHDVNGNGILDISDVQLGADGAFGGGTVAFAFSLPVSTTPKYVLVVYDFVDTIVDGTTEGGSIALATQITVTSTSVSGTFPIQFGNTIIQSTTLKVELGGFAAPPNAYQGTTGVVMGQFTLGLNTGTGTVVQINITRYSTGSGSDSDITQVRLYYDSNNDCSISGETEIGTGQALSGGVARFSSLSISVSMTLTRILVVYDFSNSATPGNKEGARISAYTDVRLSPSLAVTGSFPTAMGESTILATEMNVAPGSFSAPAFVYRGQTSVVMGQLTLSMNHSTDIVTQISLTRYGTSADSDVSSVRLFYDSNDDGSISGEIQIGTQQTFSTNAATFSSLSISVGTSVTRILVVFNISASATPGATVGAQITVGADISSTHKKVGSFPVQMGLSTIIGLSVSGVDRAPPSASPGATDLLMLELVFSATGSSIDVDTIKVTHTGTGAQGDVTSVKLYLDNGDGTYNSGSDTLLGSGTYSGGTITFGSVGVSMFTVSPGVNRRVFVVCDFSGIATGTHGVRIADVSSITTIDSGPVSGGYPIDSTETSFIPETSNPFVLVAIALMLLGFSVIIRRKRSKI